MIERNTKKSIVFVRTDEKTKQEFLDNVAKVCLDQSTVAEMLIKKWNKRMRKKGGVKL